MLRLERRGLLVHYGWPFRYTNCFEIPAFMRGEDVPLVEDPYNRFGRPRMRRGK